MIGNLESTSIVFEDDGLVLFAKHVAIRGRTRAGKGGVGGARAKLGDIVELSAHRDERSSAHRESDVFSASQVESATSDCSLLVHRTGQLA